MRPRSYVPAPVPPAPCRIPHAGRLDTGPALAPRPLRSPMIAIIAPCPSSLHMPDVCRLSSSSSPRSSPPSVLSCPRGRPRPQGRRPQTTIFDGRWRSSTRRQSQRPFRPPRSSWRDCVPHSLIPGFGFWPTPMASRPLARLGYMFCREPSGCDRRSGTVPLRCFKRSPATGCEPTGHSRSATASSATGCSTSRCHLPGLFSAGRSPVSLGIRSFATLLRHRFAPRVQDSPGQAPQRSPNQLCLPEPHRSEPGIFLLCMHGHSG